MTCKHFKKFKVFSNFRRPETHFRHAQGHQQAYPLVSSTYIFQSTFNTVFEVVHQKTVNTKLGKDYLAFRSNQRLFHDFQGKKAGRHKKTENKNALILKTYQSILQNPSAKSTSIYKEQTIILLKLNIEKVWCRQKQKTTEHFVQISVHTDMKSTKEAIL